MASRNDNPHKSLKRNAESAFPESEDNVDVPGPDPNQRSTTVSEDNTARPAKRPKHGSANCPKGITTISQQGPESATLSRINPVDHKSALAKLDAKRHFNQFSISWDNETVRVPGGRIFHQTTLYLSGTLDADSCPIWKSSKFSSTQEAKESAAQQALSWLEQHPFQNIFTRPEYTDLRKKGELFAHFVPRMPREVLQRLGYTLMHSFGLGDLVDPTLKPPHYQCVWRPEQLKILDGQNTRETHSASVPLKEYTPIQLPSDLPYPSEDIEVYEVGPLCPPMTGGSLSYEALDEKRRRFNLNLHWVEKTGEAFVDGDFKLVQEVSLTLGGNEIVDHAPIFGVEVAYTRWEARGKAAEKALKWLSDNPSATSLHIKEILFHNLGKIKAENHSWSEEKRYKALYEIAKEANLQDLLPESSIKYVPPSKTIPQLQGQEISPKDAFGAFGKSPVSSPAAPVAQNTSTSVGDPIPAASVQSFSPQLPQSFQLTPNPLASQSPTNPSTNLQFSSSTNTSQQSTVIPTTSAEPSLQISQFPEASQNVFAFQPTLNPTSAPTPPAANTNTLMHQFSFGTTSQAFSPQLTQPSQSSPNSFNFQPSMGSFSEFSFPSIALSTPPVHTDDWRNRRDIRREHIIQNGSDHHASSPKNVNTSASQNSFGAPSQSFSPQITRFFQPGSFAFQPSSNAPLIPSKYTELNSPKDLLNVFKEHRKRF